MTEQELTNLTQETFAMALTSLQDVMRMGTHENKMTAAATVLDIVVGLNPPTWTPGR